MDKEQRAQDIVPMKMLVLGIGNELYGDDGVGIQVIRKLKSELKAINDESKYLKNVVFEECSLSGLALLEVITGYDVLLIIDTIKKARPTTGKIHLLKKKDLRHIPGPSPHYVSIPQSIEIGKRLGLKVPSRIEIIAVESKNLYNLGEALTKEMEKTIPKIVEQVKSMVMTCSRI